MSFVRNRETTQTNKTYNTQVNTCTLGYSFLSTLYIESLCSTLYMYIPRSILYTRICTVHEGHPELCSINRLHANKNLYTAEVTVPWCIPVSICVPQLVCVEWGKAVGKLLRTKADWRYMYTQAMACNDISKHTKYHKTEMVTHRLLLFHTHVQCMNYHFKRCWERQEQHNRKAKQHNTTRPKQSFFKEKLAASGGIRTHNHPHFMRRSY